MKGVMILSFSLLNIILIILAVLMIYFIFKWGLTINSTINQTKDANAIYRSKIDDDYASSDAQNE